MKTKPQFVSSQAQKNNLIKRALTQEASKYINKKVDTTPPKML